MYKNIFGIIIILFISNGCTSFEYKVDSNLRKLAYDVLEHPEKLRDLIKYYPEFYDETYISKWMFDTNSINKTILYITEHSKKGKHYFSWGRAGFTYQDVKDFKERTGNSDVTLDDFSGFYLEKNDEGIFYKFVRINGKYYILRICNFRTAKL